LEELALIASGRLRPASGTAVLETSHGEDPATRADSKRRIGLVPGERLNHALFSRMSVRENISVSQPQEYLSYGRISKAAEAAGAQVWVQRLGIVPPDVEVPIGALSGGNQQKAVLARWLHIAPSALVAMEPTQGVDLAAKRDLLDQLRRAADDRPVFLVSHEPEEVLPICDRIVVMRHGAIAMEFSGQDARADRILEAFA
jgi:ABC-type sugar transport system ATPase subunit